MMIMNVRLVSICVAISGIGITHASDIEKLSPISVVSTATKTEQPIEGVTASVVVIDSGDIEQSGSQTLKDVLANTPGLTLQYGTFPAAGSVSKSSVSLRGVGATGTLWLLDGRRLAGEVKNPYDMDRIPASMIERIEVVKGPMSALYGADAVGGVINIITKKAKEGFEGSASIRYGANSDGDGAQKHLDANARGGKGKVRYSVYASLQETDPYSETENTATKVGSGMHAPSAVPAVPGYLNPNGPTGGRPIYLQADGSVSAMPLDATKLATDQAAAQVAFDQFRNGVQANVSDSYAVDVTYREESTVNTVGGRVEMDITDKIISGIELNWFDEEREGTYRAAYHPMGYLPPMGHGTNPIVGHDVEGNPISFFAANQALRGKIPAWDLPVNSYDDNTRLDISADTRWDVRDDLQLNFRLYRSDYEKRNDTTIAEYADFGYPTEAASASSGMNANVTVTSFETYGIWSPNDAHLLTIGADIREEERKATVFSQDTGFDTRSVDYKAFYVQDEWDISDTLGVTLGGRIDEYNQDGYVDALGNQRDDKTDSESTFRVGLVKNISPALNLRANVAQAYRVPDIRELFIQKQTPAGLQLGAQAISTDYNKEAHDLEPESTDSFEVGLSGQVDKLHYQAAVFFNAIDNRIQQVTVDANGDGADDYYTFNNVAEAETKGLEMSLDYALSKALNLDLSWTELDTENKDTGKELEFSPERVVALALAWAASDALNLGANLTYTGDQFYTLNAQDMTTDAYTLVNLNAAYGFGADNRIELFGGINNVFDEDVDKRLGSNVGAFYFTGLRTQF